MKIKDDAEVIEMGCYKDKRRRVVIDNVTVGECCPKARIRVYWHDVSNDIVYNEHKYSVRLFGHIEPALEYRDSLVGRFALLGLERREYKSDNPFEDLDSP